MFTVSENFIKDKVVLLRLDTDVPFLDGQIEDDRRLKLALDTLTLCLQHAKKVIVCGHLGRPNGQFIPQLSIAPVASWLVKHCQAIPNVVAFLDILENLRFEKGEDACDEAFAKQLALLAEVFVNESFAAYHQAASTTLLPKLLPSAAGLRFAKEVKTLLNLRQNPQRPQIAIIGGAKIEDKYQSVLAVSKFCDQVLVGGLLSKEIKEKNLQVPQNVLLGDLTESGIDLSLETIDIWCEIIKTSKEVIWAGPVGKYEDPLGSRGNKYLAEAILESNTKPIIGGGDLEAALNYLGLIEKLEKAGFVSTGGGAMLKLLSTLTLPSLEALN